MEPDLVKLAEGYCKHYHDEQRRKAGNQPPYSTHPFAVRDILVKYGYVDDETQAIALLHDTFEETALADNQAEIKNRFGRAVYDGVYVLSNNTGGQYGEQLEPLFQLLGAQFLDEKGFLTPEAYKLRLLFSRPKFKRVKIADMIHNTISLPDLGLEGIARKIEDAETFYIPLGNIVAPIMVKELIENINNYKSSAHFNEHLEELALLMQGSKPAQA
jgi:(p)ppGpp synthase/HD superfamily hydrolase